VPSVACVLAGLRLEANITARFPRSRYSAGDWAFSRWASHPLDYAVLLGRPNISSLYFKPALKIPGRLHNYAASGTTSTVTFSPSDSNFRISLARCKSTFCRSK